jgi:glycine C-acetyltransferase
VKPSRRPADNSDGPQSSSAPKVPRLAPVREAGSENGQPAPRISDYDYTNFFSGSGDDPFDILGPFDDWYSEARPWGYYLFGQAMQTKPATRVDIVESKGHTRLEGLINFASYNYLGLSYHPDVIRASVEATQKYGCGSAGSPILSGTLDLHEELAARVAAFKKEESALIFPTGYSANLGVIGGLMRPGDLVVADQYAHASIVDGIILSKAKARFFRHNNVDDLDRKLAGFSGKKLVVVEGVYSMDGDVASLPEIVEVCRRHRARLMIDEAHSAFLYGENGRGVVEHFGLENEVDIHLGTFSKSLGGMGGYVVGSKRLINYLRGFARARVFSCALAPGVVAGLIKALEIAQSDRSIRDRMWRNVEFAQARLRGAGIDVGDSTSQVIPVMVRDDVRIFELAEELIHEGVYVNPVRYPAVGKHRSRFRISISAAHSEEELAEGCDIMIRVLNRHGLGQCRRQDTFSATQ